MTMNLHHIAMVSSSTFSSPKIYFKEVFRLSCILKIIFPIVIIIIIWYILYIIIIYYIIMSYNIYYYAINYIIWYIIYDYIMILYYCYYYLLLLTATFHHWLFVSWGMNIHCSSTGCDIQLAYVDLTLNW